MKKIYDINITHPSLKESIIFGDTFGSEELARKVIDSLKANSKEIPEGAIFTIVERSLIENTEDLLEAVKESEKAAAPANTAELDALVEKPAEAEKPVEKPAKSKAKKTK